MPQFVKVYFYKLGHEAIHTCIIPSNSSNFKVQNVKISPLIFAKIQFVKVHNKKPDEERRKNREENL